MSDGVDKEAAAKRPAATPLSSLRVLGLASNRLRSIEGVETAFELREIYADHNAIVSLQPYAARPTTLVTTTTQPTA